MGEEDEKPSSINETSSPRYYYSSNKVADIDTELAKMRASLMEKDVLIKNLESEIEKRKETEQKLVDSLEKRSKELEESRAEIVSLKQRMDDDSSEEDDDDEEDEEEEDEEEDEEDIESMKHSLAKANKELKSAIDAEITSKKAMDDLVFALKEVATDCNVTKEKLSVVESDLEASRIEANRFKKEAEVFKNTSERLRIEAEESLIAWNGKESVFVNCIKKGEEEKNSLLDENNRLLEALVSVENLNKKSKEENVKVRDILKQAINEANVAKEALGIARVEIGNLKDSLIDKDEELEFALREIERVKASEGLANENVKKLKKLLCEIELAMEEQQQQQQQQKTLSRQDSIQEVEKQSKEQSKQSKKEKKEKKEHENLDKKMIGKTCSFSLMKLAHNHHHHHHNKHKEEEETETGVEGGGGSSDSPQSFLFKGSIFDVAETPHAQMHHKRRSSCTFLEEVETINAEDLENLEGNQLEENEMMMNDIKGGAGAVAAARKKKAFIRRFGDLLVRRKSLSFSHKKESSSSCDSSSTQDTSNKSQMFSITPTSPSPPQLTVSPEH